MKKLFTFFFLTLTALSFAQTMGKFAPVNENPFSGRLTLGIDGGITLGRTDYLDVRPLGGKHAHHPGHAAGFAQGVTAELQASPSLNRPSVARFLEARTASPETRL